MESEWREVLAKVLWVSLGGVLGANARYWLGGWAQQRWGAGFPYGTLAVNLTGSFALGLLMALLTERRVVPAAPQLRLALGIGFLGAYTTFSTFTYESLALAEASAWAPGLAYLAASVLGGLLAVWLGLRLGRIL